MSTCLEVPVPQYHPYIPPRSMSSASASILNPAKSEAEGSQAQILLLLPIWEWARAEQGALDDPGSGRTKRDGEEKKESTERHSGCKDNKRALLGCLLEKPVSHPTQHVLVSIYSYKGSSFKYNLTEDFRMACKVCPANLNCTLQSPWERRRNADNIKLAMLSVTKDMYAFKTSWKNIINFLF